MIRKWDSGDFSLLGLRTATGESGGRGNIALNRGHPPHREAEPRRSCLTFAKPSSSENSFYPLVENLLGYTFAGTTSTAQHPICTKAEEEVCKFCAAPPIPLSEDPLSWWRENELMHLNSCSYTRTHIFHKHPPVINYKLSTFTLTFVYYVVFLLCVYFPVVLYKS